MLDLVEEPLQSSRMNAAEWWAERGQLNYYQEVRRIIDDLSGVSIIDIGGWGTPIPTWGNFSDRATLNLTAVDPPEGCRGITANFLTWEPDRSYSVVTCLQVLEHIDDDHVHDFAERLRALADELLIVSVPWRWPKGSCKYHRQDPVDHDKIRSWFPAEPSSELIVRDNHLERIILTWAAI
jgi:hypothetical protein